MAFESPEVGAGRKGDQSKLLREVEARVRTSLRAPMAYLDSRRTLMREDVPSSFVVACE